MTADDEREMWTELTATKGWASLSLWASETWTALSIAQAANDTDDVVALAKLRQVMAANRAVQMLLEHPKHRLKQIDEEIQKGKQMASYSRRGGL